ncbi:MAG: dihydrolipoyl dehydrogenase [Tissierellales bacterium]
MKEYDILVLGAGPGGYVAAIKAAQMGAKTGVIEAGEVGGVCLNVGCIPTKTLLKSAKVYEYVMNAGKYGIDIKDKGGVSVNLDAMVKRKNQAVKRLTGGVKMLLEKNGVDIYNGFGEVVDKNTVKVNDQVLSTKNLIIATGSSPMIPDIEGVKESFQQGYAVTSTEVLDPKELPEHLIVVGAGTISIEFATMYNALGSKVTILQRSPRILSGIDKDLSEAMAKVLTKKGVKIIYGVKQKKFEGNKVTVEVNGEEKTFEGDKILVSLGRTPNLKGLENLNLETDRKGIITDERLRTNIEGVYAIGDINGKHLLAHVASAEGIIAVENIMGKDSKMSYDKIPSCIYSFPEIATVGLTEDEAREKGYDIIVGTFPLSANGKALAEGDRDGFVKIVANKQYGEILGMHMMASTATDMIAEGVMTMELEGTLEDLARGIHPHPTLSETVMEAAHLALGSPIHTLKQ